MSRDDKRIIVKLADGEYAHIIFQGKGVTMRKFIKNSAGEMKSHKNFVEWDKLIDAIEGQKNFL